jgi:hypothetical protein
MSRDDELVTVATFTSSMDASIAKGALEAAGIPAFVPGENVGTFARNVSVLPGAASELKVRAGDAERALAALKAAR